MRQTHRKANFIRFPTGKISSSESGFGLLFVLILAVLVSTAAYLITNSITARGNLQRITRAQGAKTMVVQELDHHIFEKLAINQSQLNYGANASLINCMYSESGNEATDCTGDTGVYTPFVLVAPVTSNAGTYSYQEAPTVVTTAPKSVTAPAPAAGTVVIAGTGDTGSAGTDVRVFYNLQGQLCVGVSAPTAICYFEAIAEYQASCLTPAFTPPCNTPPCVGGTCTIATGFKFRVRVRSQAGALGVDNTVGMKEGASAVVFTSNPTTIINAHP